LQRLANIAFIDGLQGCFQRPASIRNQVLPGYTREFERKPLIFPNSAEQFPSSLKARRPPFCFCPDGA
jgi:hypothetical protein